MIGFHSTREAGKGTYRLFVSDTQTAEVAFIGTITEEGRNKGDSPGNCGSAAWPLCSKPACASRARIGVRAERSDSSAVVVWLLPFL